MTQTGVVKRLLGNGQAEVAVERGTACGGHCSGCGECVYGKQILVPAENKIYAKPGEVVVIESETGVIMETALLVYMIPVVMLFLGYGLGALLGLGQGKCVALSLGMCVCGAVIVTLLGRRHKKIDYQITGYKR